jgi:Mus7/MMS22 family
VGKSGGRIARQPTPEAAEPGNRSQESIALDQLEIQSNQGPGDRTEEQSLDNTHKRKIDELGDNVQQDAARRARGVTIGIENNERQWSLPEYDLSILSSSPLSEPPSSPGSTPSQLRQGLHYQTPTTSPAIFGVVVGPPQAEYETIGADSREGSMVFGADERKARQMAYSLRRRNPIQEHPYLLEGEKYRQFLKQRGVRPVRLTERHSPPKKTAENSDSQEREWIAGDAESQGREEEEQAERTVTNQSVSPGTSSQLQDEGLSWNFDDLDGLGDDELPDINSLLRTKSRTYAYNRQKISLKQSNKKLSLPRLSDLRKTSSIKSRPTDAVEACDAPVDDSIRQSFRMPPSSYSDVEDVKDAKFWLDRQLKPAEKSLGPYAETSGRIGTRSVADGSTDSGSEIRSSSSPSPSPAEQPELHRIYRKIRGVLPASWLHLDQQQQAPKVAEKATRHRQLPPSDNRSPQRGVARKIQRRRSPKPIEISDESDDHQRQASSTTALHHPRQSIEDELTTIWPDIDHMEDNRVDSMLQPEPRWRRRKNTFKINHQGGGGLVEGQISGRGPATYIDNSKPRRMQQPRITDSLSQNRPTKARRQAPEKRAAPRLSILDVQRRATVSPQRIPRFIKLAIRQVRAREDKGRRGPQRKHFRLHTRDDTSEVQDILRNWKEGTINQASYAALQRSSKAKKANMISASRNESGDTMSVEEARQTISKPQYAENEFLSSAPSLQASTARLPTPKQKLRQVALPGLWDGKAKRKPLQTRRLAQLNILSGSPRRQHVAGALEIVDTEEVTYIPKKQTIRTAPEGLDSVLDRLYHSRRQKPQLNSPHHTNVWPTNNRHAPITTDVINLEKEAPVALLNDRQKTSRSKRTHQSRKRQPRRVDAECVEYRQPSETILSEPDESLTGSDIEQHQALTGFGPYATRYSVTFDIHPLPAGTYFHGSSFVGSGDFASALHTGLTRSLEEYTQPAEFVLAAKKASWGTWDESVASDLSFIFDWVVEKITLYINDTTTNDDISSFGYNKLPEVQSMLRFVSKYLSNTLNFSDSIDRKSFIIRFLHLLQNFLEGLVSLRSSDIGLGKSRQSAEIITFSFITVLAYQLLAITRSGAFRDSLAEVEDVFRLSSDQLLQSLIMCGRHHVRSYFEEQRSHTKREAGTRNLLIESWVVAYQTLEAAGVERASFWYLVHSHLQMKRVLLSLDVRVFETIWHDMFTLLPLQELDEVGIIQYRKRFGFQQEDWTIVRDLSNRLFSIYNDNPTKQPAMFNTYCRTVFSRCHYLIKEWGWLRCEPIIGTLYDFFAINRLSDLDGEEHRGSARFLENLDQSQELEVEVGDNCFHVLLKIIAIGLRGLMTVYNGNGKKVRNVAFRLMPNHGRKYPKESFVYREELDCLRNHHDLLSTLYWASPPGYRPSLNAIKDLVDPETSHREACHISIRAWSNLIRFQLSTDEPSISLQPFMEWLNELLSNMLLQHALARSEAQAQFALASASGQMVSTGVLESTISKNQQQVEAVVSDALLSLTTAMSLARNCQSAIALLTTGLLALPQSSNA